MILSWSLLVLSFLKRTRDYFTYTGPPSCINLWWNIAPLLVQVNVLENSCPALLTKILTVIKTAPEKYCGIKTSHTGVINMWILKNSTNLLSSLSHLGVHRATSIQTFDFSTLYTSIPHDLLKFRLNNIINNAFKHKNGATRYTHIKIGRNKSYFTSDPLNGDNKYTANDIGKMIEFLVDNIYVRCGGQLFRQMVGIHMGTNCAHYWLTCFSIPMKMSF